jgi:outer membrane receptor protein involved in Fe transport
VRNDQPVVESFSKGYERWLLCLLLLVTTFSFSDRVIIQVLGQAIKEDLSLTDLQLGLLSCPSLTPVAPCAATFNAGDADIRGYEIEVEAHPIDGLTLDVSFSDLNFEYKKLLTDANGNNITGLTAGQKAPGPIPVMGSGHDV